MNNITFNNTGFTIENVSYSLDQLSIGKIDGKNVIILTNSDDGSSQNIEFCKVRDLIAAFNEGIKSQNISLQQLNKIHDKIIHLRREKDSSLIGKLVNLFNFRVKNMNSEMYSVNKKALETLLKAGTEKFYLLKSAYEEKSFNLGDTHQFLNSYSELKEMIEFAKMLKNKCVSDKKLSTLITDCDKTFMELDDVVQGLNKMKNHKDFNKLVQDMNLQISEQKASNEKESERNQIFKRDILQIKLLFSEIKRDFIPENLDTVMDSDSIAILKKLSFILTTATSVNQAGKIVRLIFGVDELQSEEIRSTLERLENYDIGEHVNVYYKNDYQPLAQSIIKNLNSLVQLAEKAQTSEISDEKVTEKYAAYQNEVLTFTEYNELKEKSTKDPVYTEQVKEVYLKYKENLKKLDDMEEKMGFRISDIGKLKELCHQHLDQVRALCVKCNITE